MLALIRPALSGSRHEASVSLRLVTIFETAGRSGVRDLHCANRPLGLLAGGSLFVLTGNLPISWWALADGTTKRVSIVSICRLPIWSRPL